MKALQGRGLETVLRRERALVIAGLAVIVALSWTYMVHLAWGMRDMSMGAEMAMPLAMSWSISEVAMTFVMWAVMMVAMMVPSAAPMIVLFATVNRRRREQGGVVVSTSVFLLGYLIVWTGFAAIATGAQWALHEAALLTSAMGQVTPVLGAAILLAAGVFQWTPLKDACLRHCRSPLGFVMTRWREGTGGALVMGLEHGAFCTGCCWFLMGLMFVGGVMNLLWMAAIAAYILLEKVLPAGERLGRTAGLALVAWGLWTLI